MQMLEDIRRIWGRREPDEQRLAHEARLAQNPEDVQVLLALAECHGRHAQYAEAEACLLRAVRLRPDDPAVRQAQGDLLWAAGKRYEAMGAYGAGAELCPADTRLAACLARAMARGQRTQAEVAFARLWRRDNLAVEALEAIADGYLALGQLRPALQAYWRALRLADQWSGRLRMLRSLGSAPARWQATRSHGKTKNSSGRTLGRPLGPVPGMLRKATRLVAIAFMAYVILGAFTNPEPSYRVFAGIVTVLIVAGLIFIKDSDGRAA
jgi:tetratricopeptide (TPR) repeat protein